MVQQNKIEILKLSANNINKSTIQSLLGCHYNLINNTIISNRMQENKSYFSNGKRFDGLTILELANFMGSSVNKFLTINQIKKQFEDYYEKKYNKKLDHSRTSYARTIN